MKNNLRPLILRVPEVVDRDSAARWLEKQSEAVKRVTTVADDGTLLQRPDVHQGAFVDDSARLYGAMIVSNGCYVGPMAVIRLDELDTPEPLVIGEWSNIQDGAVVHSTTRKIGNRVIIAHQSILHGAVLEDDVSLYIQAVVDGGGTVIGKCSFLHQGSYVGKGVHVPEGRYVEPGQKVLNQAAAEDLPPVPEAIKKLRDHVLELNMRHVKTYSELKKYA